MSVRVLKLTGDINWGNKLGTSET